MGIFGSIQTSRRTLVSEIKVVGSASIFRGLTPSEPLLWSQDLFQVFCCAHIRVRTFDYP
jgi:hypothetical protein